MYCSLMLLLSTLLLLLFADVAVYIAVVVLFCVPAVVAIDSVPNYVSLACVRVHFASLPLYRYAESPELLTELVKQVATHIGPFARPGMIVGTPACPRRDLVRHRPHAVANVLGEVIPEKYSLRAKRC